MSKAILTLVSIASLLPLSFPGLLRAAELPLPTREPPSVANAPSDCGPCGCVQVTYVRHPELESTYGLGYDPRNFDTSQPYYYWGRIRAYPRYFLNGWTGPSGCWNQ
jgi:hypothetical protein